jgi:hypothetical protein
LSLGLLKKEVAIVKVILNSLNFYLIFKAFVLFNKGY